MHLNVHNTIIIIISIFLDLSKIAALKLFLHPTRNFGFSTTLNCKLYLLIIVYSFFSPFPYATYGRA